MHHCPIIVNTYSDLEASLICCLLVQYSTGCVWNHNKVELPVISFHFLSLQGSIVSSMHVATWPQHKLKEKEKEKSINMHGCIHIAVSWAEWVREYSPVVLETCQKSQGGRKGTPAQVFDGFSLCSTRWFCVSGGSCNNYYYTCVYVNIVFMLQFNFILCGFECNHIEELFLLHSKWIKLKQEHYFILRHQ